MNKPLGGPAESRTSADARAEILGTKAASLVPLVSERLEAARRRIEAAGGDPAAVTIVAVTKTFGPGYALAALACGIEDLGENYADELVEKARALDEAAAPPARWHFLGSIQRNKIGRLAPFVDCWQGVSRPVEVEAIVRRSPGPVRLFVEVNLAGDPSRPGCDPAAVPGLLEAARATGAEVRGLMAVAPHGDADVAEGAFRRLAAMARSLGLDELSMGMSADLESAVRAGTTMLRLGTALFGPRNPRATR